MRRPFILLLALALGGTLAVEAVSQDAAVPQKTDLFEAGQAGYALYRIPGLIATPKGTLLAYCEARKNASGDWGQIDLMLRRSTDGGQSWEAPRRLVEPPAVPKNPVAAAQGLGKAGEVTLNNPVAIADRKTGAVHFLYCVEYLSLIHI